MALVRLALFPGGTSEHYAALAEALGAQGDAPGRLVFAAGPVDGGWQVVQIWRSREELDAFNTAVLRPAMTAAGGPFPAPPQVVDFETLELDVRSDQARRRPPPDGTSA